MVGEFMVGVDTEKRSPSRLTLLGRIGLATKLVVKGDRYANSFKEL